MIRTYTVAIFICVIFACASRAATVDLVAIASSPHRIGVVSDTPTFAFDALAIGRRFGAGGVPILYRTFFTYDLSGIGGKVVAAELRMFNGLVETPHATETVGLYEVSTPIDQLLAGTSPTTILADLGDGVQYGSNSEFAPSLVFGTIRSFQLNSAALSAINLGGIFAMGASLDSIGTSDQFEVVSGRAVEMRSATLRLTVVPEPTAAMLAVSAVFGFASIRRRAVA